MKKQIKQSQYVPARGGNIRQKMNEVKYAPVRGGNLPQPGNAGLQKKALQDQAMSRRKVLKQAINTLRGQ